MSIEDEISREIGELKEKIGELDRRIEEANKKINKSIAERDKTHTRMREIKEKVRALKEEKATLVEESRGLRRDVRELRQKLLNYIIEKRQLRGELKSLRLSMDVNRIKKRLDEIDLYLASHRVSREEERRLFEEASKLETMLVDYEKALKIHLSLNELSPQMEEVRKELEEKRKRLDEVSTRLNQISTEMEMLNNVYDNLKVEADRHHSSYLEAREERDRLEAERILAASKIYEFYRLLRGKREELMKRRISEVKAKRKKEAIAKLERGEKLEFEEMKILLEDETLWQTSGGTGQP
ncbi:MAG: hypothetical protein NZ938_03365 [Aigarchaeota archaeon]|nr:hypothetical protein [Candidatus Calditenuaceae archaeon]